MELNIKMPAHRGKAILKVIHLEEVRNVRDIGGVPINSAFAGEDAFARKGIFTSESVSADEKRLIKHGLFFRGAHLSSISESDKEILFEQLRVRCVIDVRTGWERELKPDPVIENVENFHIPFYDKEKVGLEYTKKLPNTIRIGHDFACDQLDFYYSLSNERTVEQMKKCIETAFKYANAGKSVYFHCTGGKDRAGILAVLILEILGASYDEILKDYLFTNVSRDAHIQPTYERFLRLCQGDEERARKITESHCANKNNLNSFYKGVKERYGSMESFIENQLGVSLNVRKTFIENCTEIL